MSFGTTTRNTIAAYVGRAWSSVLIFAFVPLYLRLLGPEAYGLVGLFTTFQALLQIFDIGLSATMTRELARLAPLAAERRTCRDILKTFELLYWAIGLTIVVFGLLTAPFATHFWFKSAKLPASTLTTCLILTTANIGAFWPASLYTGGLVGIQRHVALNATNAIFYSIRFGGAALALWLISPSPVVYFTWHLGSGLVHVLYLRQLLWRFIPQATTWKATFRWSLLRARSGLIAGLSASSAALLLFTQVDKVLVSRLVSLEQFAYYSLAWSAGAVFQFFYLPVGSVLFPRLSQLRTQNDPLMAQLYSYGSDVIAVTVIPTAAVLAVYSHEILALWVRQPEAVENTYLLLRWLAPFGALGSWVHLSNMYQWACGWTAFISCSNFISAILFIPIVPFVEKRWGLLGVIIAWGVFRTTQALVQLSVTHARLLRGGQWAWYASRLRSVLVSSAVVLLFKPLMGPGTKNLQMLCLLSATWSTATILCVAASPTVRGLIMAKARSFSAPFAPPQVVSATALSMRRLRILAPVRWYSTFIRRDFRTLAASHSLTIVQCNGVLGFLNGLIDLIKCDVLFCWFANLHFLPYALAARLLGKPVIVIAGGYEVAHVPEIPYGSMVKLHRRVLTRLLLRSARSVVCVSESTARQAEQWGNVGRHKLVVVHHGFEPVPSDRNPLREPVVLTVASADITRIHIKGLDIFAAVSRLMPNVGFVLAGGLTSAAGDQLRHWTGPNVEFVGELEPRELALLYQRATIYFQPSRHESFGCAIAEAMQYGCIPVAPRSYAIPELIGESGIYIDLSDLQGIVHSILNGLNGKVSFIESPADRVRRLFPGERRAEALLDVIRRSTAGEATS